MKDKFFSNKIGLYSFCIYIVTFLLSLMQEELTILFVLVLAISAISGLYFGLWICVKLIAFIQKKSSQK